METRHERRMSHVFPAQSNFAMRFQARSRRRIGNGTETERFSDSLPVHHVSYAFWLFHFNANCSISQPAAIRRNGIGLLRLGAGWAALFAKHGNNGNIVKTGHALPVFVGILLCRITSFWNVFMRKVFSSSLLLLTVLSIAALSACSTTKRIDDQNETFSSTNTYSHSFAGSGPATCEAARRALLSQGYVINEAQASLIKGRKNFQPESDIHVQIEFHVVCAPDGKGSNSTTAFANAVRDRYSLKKSSNSASLGVGVIGSLSLPFGSSDESLVKVASETIPTGQFYDRFFELVESYLDGASGTSAEEAASKDAMRSGPDENGADPDFR
jgi:hypothetical protein